jgi:hypothetical protein
MRQTPQCSVSCSQTNVCSLFVDAEHESDGDSKCVKIAIASTRVFTAGKPHLPKEIIQEKPFCRNDLWFMRSQLVSMAANIYIQLSPQTD